MKKNTTGVIIGKFMPLHNGHKFLINFAKNYVDTLYVLVDNPSDATIDLMLRYQWVKDSFRDHNVNVKYIPHKTPQDPSEHSNFYNIWKDTIYSLVGTKPDYLFASEEYGFELSEALDTKYIILDINRKTIDISATKIRTNLFKYFDYLPHAVRCYYRKKVCIFGPECTGKTTLVKQLSNHYNTIAVPEYAELFLEANSNLQKENLLQFAKAQVAAQKAVEEFVEGPILFCTTDPLTATIWHKWLYNSENPEIIDIAKQYDYDHYLLMKPDLPWSNDDGKRYTEGKTEEFFQRCIETLEKFERKYTIIDGYGQDRFDKAIKVINNVLQT